MEGPQQQLADYESAVSVGGVPPPPQTRVAWSKHDLAFRVVTAADTAPSEPRQQFKSTTFDAALVQLASLVSSSDGVANDLGAFIALRERLLRRILQVSDPGGSSSMHFLQPLLVVWRRGLDQLERQGRENFLARLSLEFSALAEACMLVGDVVQARAALGASIRLGRGKSFNQSELVLEVHKAKTFLLQCVRYEHDFVRCKKALQHQQPPLTVLRALLDELTALQLVAPFAEDVVALKAQVLTALHRAKEVVAMLAAFPFTSQSMKLTLAYATALELEGFYQASLAVATDLCPSVCGGGEGSVAEALAAHGRLLTTVLAKKALADDALLQSKFVAAEEAFTVALAAVNPESGKLRAALLLGRANALIGLERLLSARRDLEQSLKLDPSSQIVRLRLRTVDLAQETQQINRRLHRGMASGDAPEPIRRQDFYGSAV